MNRVKCFTRQIVSVIALATLVLAGWSQLGHAQPAGIDPQAEKLLRRMSDYLAGRQQFTLKAESTPRSRADIRAEAAVRQSRDALGIATEQVSCSSQG